MRPKRLARRLPLLGSAIAAMIIVATASGCGGAEQPADAGGFGTGGKVFTKDPSFDFGVASVQALVVQNDGKIVLTTGKFDLFRYTKDGHLDRSFGSDGKVRGAWGVARRGIPRGTSFTMAVQGDGKIVLAGSIPTGRYYNTLPLDDFALARYTPRGRLDRTFGKGGKVRTHLVPKDAPDSRHSSFYINVLAIQRDGKILAGGLGSGSGARWSGWALARYTASGGLDPSFGQGGMIFTRAYSGFAIALEDDGKIVVAGTTETIGWRPHPFVLARYSSDGRLDPSFGQGGLELTAPFRRPVGEPAYRGPSGGPESAHPVAIAIRPHGKIVVAGSSDSGIALARYTAAGDLDPSFGRGGTTNDDPQRLFGADGGVYAAAFQRDGKIISVGRSVVPHSDWKTDFALVRHREDGELDSSFGHGGVVLANLGAGSEAWVVAIQRDGKIVTGGKGQIEGGPSIALARFMPDGRLDR